MLYSSLLKVEDQAARDEYCNREQNERHPHSDYAADRMELHVCVIDQFSGVNNFAIVFFFFFSFFFLFFGDRYFSLLL